MWHMFDLLISAPALRVAAYLSLLSLARKTPMSEHVLPYKVPKAPLFLADDGADRAGTLNFNSPEGFGKQVNVFKELNQPSRDQRRVQPSEIPGGRGDSGQQYAALRTILANLQ